MGWASFAIEALRRGETVKVKPRGHSMRGKVNNGDIVTLAPADPAQLAVGDIVLVRVKGHESRRRASVAKPMPENEGVW